MHFVTKALSHMQTETSLAPHKQVQINTTLYPKQNKAGILPGDLKNKGILYSQQN